MKDQYVGDINDYCKYLLLRELSATHDGRLVIAWMRTSRDNRTDGRRLAYLQQPGLYRSADPELFDLLHELVAAGHRSITAVQESGILPGARFHSEFLPDSADGRERWFAILMSSLKPGDLVFLDPDNGLAVPSVVIGRRGSSKYLYWDELAAVLQDGRLACVYQHFPRRARGEYISELLNRIPAVVSGTSALVVSTRHVAFVIVGRPQRLTGLLEAATRVVARLPSVLRLAHERGVERAGCSS